jgi:twitching motility protein PilT
MSDVKALIGTLLDLVINEGGSDLHLSAGSNPIIRVSGSLVPLLQQKVLTAEDTMAILKEMAPEERFAQLASKQSIDFSYSHTVKARFRVNGYMVQGAAALAMRLIPHETQTFEKLNLPPILEVFTQRSQGFFLLVGPVGQGKSTTMAAIIERINETSARKILTIEDPVEYLFDQKKSLIHQREVHVDAPDFASALTAAFREDVNVIMVGEMRDQETIASAVTAAETGHLVLSTLTRTTQRRPLTVLSTCSLRISKDRFVCSWQVLWLESSHSVWCPVSREALFLRMNSSSITAPLRTLFAKAARTKFQPLFRPVLRRE